MRYIGGTNLTCYVNDQVTVFVDPQGLSQTELPGPFPPMTVDDFISAFRPVMPKPVIESGCVGVVGACLGYADLYWTKQLTHCFDRDDDGLQKAQSLATRWNEANRCGKDGGKCIYGRAPKARVVFLQFSTQRYYPNGRFREDELRAQPNSFARGDFPRNREEPGAFDLSSDWVWRIIRTPVRTDGMGADFDFAIYCGAESGWADWCWLGANHGAPGMIVVPIDPGLGHWGTFLKGIIARLNKTFYCVVCEATVNESRK